MKDVPAADPLATFSNLLDRPRGPVLSALGAVLPGIRAVAAQREPYAAAWARANHAALNADGPLWVALGDSLTQGIGASAPERGWVGQAARRLADDAGASYRIVNLSMTGARTDDVIERQLPVLGTLPAPALVTVLVGSNDMLSRTHRRLLGEAFIELIDGLPDGTVMGYVPQRGAALAANAAIDRAVADRGFTAVSVQTDWHGKLAADHFHPNDLGYRAIADAYTAAILGGTRSGAPSRSG